MDACDVLIVGGGPAGSACAWQLRRSGLDVVVVDRARFPRDKVCAGWIAPPALEILAIDPGEYARGRILQPFARFRVGVYGVERATDVVYERPVSFGVRRVEFDDYLLRRSGAQLRLGEPVQSLQRDRGRWVVNGTIAAPMIVGAAGHGCPVARLLNPPPDRAPLVAAQEIEVELDARQQKACAVAPDRPELYFCPDLAGYGWALRKGRFLNVGLGRVRAQALPAAAAAFVGFLKSQRRIPDDLRGEWRGHAYLLDERPRRRCVDDGVLLAGDAAGLACPGSGEGIRPAIESGLLAASAIVEAAGRYTASRLAIYEHRLHRSDSLAPLARTLRRAVPTAVWSKLAASLIGAPWFARHFLVDRWFLHQTGVLRPVSGPVGP